MSSVSSNGDTSIIEVNGLTIKVNKKNIYINGNKVNKETNSYKESNTFKLFFGGLILGGILSKVATLWILS